MPTSISASFFNALSAFAWHGGKIEWREKKGQEKERKDSRDKRDMVGPKEIIPSHQYIKFC